MEGRFRKYIFYTLLALKVVANSKTLRFLLLSLGVGNAD